MTVARLDDYRQADVPARPLPYNLEAEQALLGAVLVNNAAFHAIGPRLAAEHFAEENHQRIWTVISALVADGKVATPVTLKTFLGDHDVGDGVTVPRYLARLAADAVTVVNAPDYASLVVDLHARRELIGLAGELAAQAYDPPAALPVERLIDGAEAGLTALRTKFAVAEKTRALAGDMATELLATTERRRAGAEKRRGVSSGLPDFDRDAGGLCEGELVIVAGRPGMGKAQPLDSPILTRNGWVPMGEIGEGSWVVRPNGGATRVVSVHPQGRLPVFRVRFHDGRHTLCCGDHLWRVWHRHWNAWRDVPLRDLMTYQDVTRFSVPLASADWGGGAFLRLPPYMLGVLLGDGYFHPHGVQFSTSDEEIVEAVRALCPGGHNVERRGPYHYAITAGRCGGGVNIVLDAVRALGLGDARSDTKFVPPPYLSASQAQRLSLLQGLLDTDGTVEPSKTIRYSSTSAALAGAVVYLARSLGAWAKVRQRAQPRHTYKGETRDGKPCWMVTIRHREPHTLFRLARHRSRLGDGGQYSEGLRLSISSIEPAGEAECQCIKLGDDDGLYFTDDFTVTHNTIIGTNLARAAAKAGAGTLLYSLEVPREQTTARILADLAYIARKPLSFGHIMRGEYDDEDLWRLQDAQRRLAEIPLVIDCASRLTVAQIASRARAERLRLERAGLRLGVIVIDYLKFVAASDRYQGQRHYEVGEISAGLKQLAKDMGLCVVLLAQLNRGVESRPDKRPGLADLRESGDLEADADVVAFVYRDAYYLQQSPEYRKNDPETVARAIDTANDLELIIAKNRSGPLKTHHLWCDVACSKVSARDMGGP